MEPSGSAGPAPSGGVPDRRDGSRVRAGSRARGAPRPPWPAPSSAARPPGPPTLPAAAVPRATGRGPRGPRTLRGRCANRSRHCCRCALPLPSARRSGRGEGRFQLQDGDRHRARSSEAPGLRPLRLPARSGRPLQPAAGRGALQVRRARAPRRPRQAPGPPRPLHRAWRGADFLRAPRGRPAPGARLGSPKGASASDGASMTSPGSSASPEDPVGRWRAGADGHGRWTPGGRPGAHSGQAATARGAETGVPSSAGEGLPARTIPAATEVGSRATHPVSPPAPPPGPGASCGAAEGAASTWRTALLKALAVPR